MADKRLLSYFESGVRDGHSLDSLKGALLEAGWNEELIDEARTFFVMNIKSKNKVSDYSGKRSHSKKSKKVILVLIVYFLVAIWWIGAFIFTGIQADSLLDETSLIALIGGIVFSIVLLLAGFGILNGNNGWRMVGIFLSVLLILVGFFSLLSFNIFSMISLLLSLYLFFELKFDKEIKNHFN